MVLAILRALAAVTRRDLAGYSLIRTNNFFLFVALLIWGALVSGVEPVSSYPFLALLAFLLFFPVANDPLEKIPAVRLGLWPLAARGRLALRIASFFLNPILWITAALLMFRDPRLFWTAGVVVGAAFARARVPRHARGFFIERAVPLLPGDFGVLLTHHLREMLTVLDTWLALVLAVIGLAWRDPSAAPILGILTGIALSTWTQSASGLDATRYRLLPIPAWKILLARDTAYLAIQLALTLGLSPLTGLAFGLTAIAVGRYPALTLNLRQQRWRFAVGRVWFGAAQMILGVALSLGGAWGLAAAIALWLGSLFWGGLTLAQRFRGIDAGRAPGR